MMMSRLKIPALRALITSVKNNPKLLGCSLCQNRSNTGVRTFSSRPTRKPDEIRSTVLALEDVENEKSELQNRLGLRLNKVEIQQQCYIPSEWGKLFK